MKKILIILVLFSSFFFYSNIGYSKQYVKLPNDVSSGDKYTKSLTGDYYKDYGFQVVDKKDGHPVRAGKKSIRFEVRSGDCGTDKDGEWDDCKNDRERHELSGKNFKDGVQLACIVEAEDFDYNTDEFGPDAQQNAQFHILRQTLLDLNLISSNIL